MPPQLMVERFATILRDKHHMILAVPLGMAESLAVWHDKLPLGRTLSGSRREFVTLTPGTVKLWESPGRAGGLPRLNYNSHPRIQFSPTAHDSPQIGE